MEHLLNAPIEAEDIGDQCQHTNGDSVKLCFFYHRGLIVGHDVVLRMHGTDIRGTAYYSRYISENLFKVEVVFMSEIEAFKMRMLEQAIHIEKYQKDNPHLSLEEAANQWVLENGAFFPKK
jgi:hypothetical protein